jgi:hypothetical protein
MLEVWQASDGLDFVSDGSHRELGGMELQEEFRSAVEIYQTAYRHSAPRSDFFGGAHRIRLSIILETVVW